MGVSHYMKQELARLQEENEELREEVYTLRHYIDSIQALLEAIDALNPEAEIMPLLDTILFNGLTVLAAQAGSLLVVDDENNELVFVLARGGGSNQLVGRRMPIDKGIAGWVVQNRKPSIVNNARADDRFYARIDQSLQFTTNSILASPIIGGSRVLGVIEVLNKQDGKPFNKTDEVLLVLLCRFAGEFLFRMLEEENGNDSAENTEPTVQSDAAN